MNKTRVLLIDDEERFTTPMRELLERRAGYEVMAENHPEKAVATARTFRPDIILLDVSMPPTDGGAVAEELHQVPALKRTPIIFLTALVTVIEAPNEPEPFIAKHHRIPKETDVNEVIQAIEQQLALAAARA